MDRPQKSLVFHDKSKAKSKSSKMGLIFITERGKRDIYYDKQIEEAVMDLSIPLE